MYHGKKGGFAGKREHGQPSVHGFSPLALRFEEGTAYNS
jgi:hypothetical protein